MKPPNHAHTPLDFCARCDCDPCACHRANRQTADERPSPETVAEQLAVARMDLFQQRRGDAGELTVHERALLRRRADVRQQRIAAIRAG